jgi:hypothetical protein
MEKGKNDKHSAWAVARKTIAEPMLDLFETGKKIDNGELTLQEAFENTIKNDAAPPIYKMPFFTLTKTILLLVWEVQVRMEAFPGDSTLFPWTEISGSSRNDPRVVSCRNEDIG